MTAAEALTKVYVVDDDPIARLVMKGTLAAAGYSVECFGSPLAFLDAVRAEVPGCVVLDVKMPELDGIAVAQALQQKAAGGLSVVFVSGAATVPDAVRAMKTGPADFLCKPFEPAELLRVVRSALAGAKTAQAERASASARFAALSPVEQRVIRLAVQGLLYKQIAAELKLSESSVRNYRVRAEQRLGLTSLPDLVRFLDLVDGR